MASKATRVTTDLSEFPDLVVIYLGMRVRRPRGVLRLLGLGPQIQRAWKAEPDGLLAHEDFIWSLFPLHLGMREYWRDLDSLERWVRSDPHRQWWQRFLRDTGGTGFWHEAYTNNGPIETIYDDMSKPVGIMRFAPTAPARGPAFSARTRLRPQGPTAPPPVVAEAELYDVGA